MSKIKYVGETALNALVEKIKSITGTVTGVMRFVGSLKELPKDNTSYNKGDVILVGTKEYVLNETDGNKVWVEIGDEKMWLSENDIIPYNGEPEKLIDDKNHIYIFTIGTTDIYFNADLSELASKRFVDDQLETLNGNIKNYINKNYISQTFTSTKKVIYKFDNTNGYNINNTIIEVGGIKSEITIDLTDVYNQINSIKANNTKYDFYEPTFEFNDNNGHKIKQKYIIKDGKEAGITIDLTDVYSKIDFIKTNYLKIDNFNKVIYNLENKMKGHFTKSSNITSDGHIPLSLTDNTPIAHTDDIKKDIVLDTKKFVEDLKAEFINTGFVHDDSNTKTTFEEITYEEVENLFK